MSELKQLVARPTPAGTVWLPMEKIVRAALKVATCSAEDREAKLAQCKPHIREAIEAELGELRWRWKEWPAPFSEIAEMEPEVQTDTGWRGWNVRDAQQLCLERYDSVGLAAEVRELLDTKMARG